MSDTPKKPARKKNPPKAEADAPKARAGADAQTNKVNDQQMREAVLAAVLPHAAFDGFTDSVLQKAGTEAGASKAELARLFENGPISLIEFYSNWADAEMEKRLATTDLKAMKIRERIGCAVKTRLAILKPQKEAARRAAALLSLPMHAALGAKLLYRTVDAMWRATGDTSTDFNFYTKRAILAGVYSATLMRWFTDQSQDETATDAFLSDRIENVMQFERFKAQVKEGMARLPSLSEVLGAFNARRG